MRCLNCQAEAREGAAFCGNCGAALPQAADEPVVPMVPEPEILSAPEPATTPAPTAPLPPPAAPQPPMQPAYDPVAYAQQPQPPRKRKTGLIIAIVAIVLLALCGCLVAGLFALTPIFRSGGSTPEPGIGVTEPGTLDPGTAEPAGYASADAAAVATLEADGLGDWVYQIYDDMGDTVVYWAGPPASEWALAITVARTPAGTWEVVDVVGLDFGGDVFEGDMTPYDQAVDVVGQYLYAVKEDRGLEAQAFTVDPFYSDPASAQEADGQLASFEVTEAREQSDRSFWVRTVQNWSWGSEQWEYWVVPTEMGYAIADIRQW